MNCARAWSLLVLLSGLAACGGGSDRPDVVLPVADGQPEAYSTTYLSQHPEMLVQPQHMIIASLGRGDASARLYVDQAMTVNVDTADEATAVGGIDIVDEKGQNWVRHVHGSAAAQALLLPGKYRVVFHPAAVNADAARTTHFAYLKLADTALQAQARLLRDQSSTLLAAATGDPAFLRQQLLGVGTSDACIACSFNGADLQGNDFTGQELEQSTFVGANLNNADFAGADCRACQLTSLRIVNGTYVGFDRADLELATIQGYFAKVSFRGADLQSAVVTSAEFNACDFGPAPDGTATSLRNADLTGAYFLNWGVNAGIRQADFTNAKGRQGMFGRPNLEDETDKMSGAVFANMTPNDIFVGFNFTGMDLSGVNFAGMDLSQADFSKSNGVILSATTDLWDAVLTDGTTGIKLRNQDFGTAFKKFAGSSDGTSPGKDLRHVDFTGVNLYQADLTGVRLDGAILVGADLAQTSLYKASLVGAQLGATPDDATTAAANLSGAYMAKADLTDADVRSVKFDSAHIYGGVKFLRARADSASMNNTILADADFTQASLSDANFSNAILVNANFSGANLQNAELYNTYVQGASFVTTTTVSGANLTNAYVSTDSGSWSFKEADGTPYVYGYQATALGDLATGDRGIAICPDGELGPCTGSKLVPTKSVPYPPPPPCIPKSPDDCLPPHP